MPEAAIRTTGKILERKGEILYRVELMNGKVVLGHLSKPLTDARAELPDGARILLELTPYDFDQARILELLG
jgi:translation initiation factor IF-1